MPLARVSLQVGRSAALLAGIADAIYESLRAVFNVPEGDRFVIIEQRAAGELFFDRHYLVAARTDGVIFIQITANNTRSAGQKQALYRELADRLIAIGVASGDVFINLMEVLPENWSFGDGRMAYPPEPDSAALPSGIERQAQTRAGPAAVIKPAGA